MTRVEFLTELDHRLSSLSKAEADEHLAYYAEMLADRMEDGMNEEEAVASMESLDTIAARILGTAYTKPRKKNSDLGHTILCLGLIGFLVAVLIGLLVGVSTVTYETIEPGYSDMIIVEEQVVPDEVILMSVNVSEIRSIEVSWGNGDVILEAWDDSHIGIMDDWNEAQYVNEGGDSALSA